MRRFFTKHLLLIALGFLSVDMMGQAINTLTINGPAGIAGNYEVVRAAFGSTSNNPVTANAAFVNDGSTTPTGTATSGTINDGCQAPTNTLTGTIGFVDRGGGCGFTDKVAFMQTAGAVAVVICQNADVWPFVAGGTNANITIPVFTLSLADCNKIRVDVIAGTANATLRYLYECDNVDPNYGPTVVWGKTAGQGDFTGGLNGWEVSNQNTWEFNATGQITKQNYSADVNVGSFTPCDGVAEFNSDFLDNGGTSAFGTGLCPSLTSTGSSAAPPCIGELISPVIDLDGTSIVGITIEFSQAYRSFSSDHFIIASKDGGTTWSDTIKINDELNIYNGRTKVAISGYAGVSKLRFKFRYESQYYYWAIDDVVVHNEVLPDVKVNRNFFAVAPTLRVPKTQITPMPFLADVSNIGNRDAADTKLEVAIFNGADEIARLENVYGNIAAGTSVENVLFTEQFTPAADAAFYEAAYIISSPDDYNEGNDVAEFFFEVTENTFGNLLPEAAVNTPNYMEDVTGFWAVTPSNFYSAGNAYFLPEGDGYTVDKVRFGLENTLDQIEGTGFVQVDLYEWIDGIDPACNPLERVLVGTNSVFLSSDDISNPRLIEIPLFAVDAEGSAIEGSEIILKDNANYVLMAHTIPLEPSAPRYRFLSYSGTLQTSSFDRSIYNEGTNFALTEAGQTRFAGSLWNIDGVDDTDIADRTFDRLGNNVSLYSFATMYLEMDIRLATSTYDIAKSGTANVFPNPASRELYIDVTLDNVSANVRVDLVTIEGKVATSKSFTNVQDSRLKLDLSGLTSGTYTAMIHTDNGVIAKKVVVQK
jgi:hypothetical protein